MPVRPSKGGAKHHLQCIKSHKANILCQPGFRKHPPVGSAHTAKSAKLGKKHHLQQHAISGHRQLKDNRPKAANKIKGSLSDKGTYHSPPSRVPNSQKQNLWWACALYIYCATTVASQPSTLIVPPICQPGGNICYFKQRPILVACNSLTRSFETTAILANLQECERVPYVRCPMFMDAASFNPDLQFIDADGTVNTMTINQHFAYDTDGTFAGPVASFYTPDIGLDASMIQDCELSKIASSLGYKDLQRALVLFPSNSVLYTMAYGVPGAWIGMKLHHPQDTLVFTIICQQNLWYNCPHSSTDYMANLYVLPYLDAYFYWSSTHNTEMVTDYCFIIQPFIATTRMSCSGQFNSTTWVRSNSEPHINSTENLTQFFPRSLGCYTPLLDNASRPILSNECPERPYDTLPAYLRNLPFPGYTTTTSGPTILPTTLSTITTAVSTPQTTESSSISSGTSSTVSSSSSTTESTTLATTTTTSRLIGATNLPISTLAAYSNQTTSISDLQPASTTTSSSPQWSNSILLTSIMAAISTLTSSAVFPTVGAQSGGSMPGKYILFPDLRSPFGKLTFYDEHSAIIWHESKTMLVSHADDTITLVETFVMPEVNDTLIQTSAQRDFVESLRQSWSATTAYYGQSIQDCSNGTCTRGIGDAIVCGFKHLFGGTCEGGGNKAAMDQMRGAVNSLGDAVKNQQGQLDIIAKQEETLKQLADNTRSMVQENSAAIQKLSESTSKQLEDLANQGAAEFQILVRMIQSTNYLSTYGNKIAQMIEQIHQYVDSVRMIGSPQQSNAGVWSRARNQLPSTLGEIKSENCRLRSSAAFVKDGVKSITFTTIMVCVQPEQTYTIFKPSPLTFSPDGLSFLTAEKDILHTVLLLADGLTQECSSIKQLPSGQEVAIMDHPISTTFSGSMCNMFRALYTPIESLNACDETESTYFCLSYQVNTLPPPFISEGLQFPWNDHTHTYVTNALPKAYFPFTTLTDNVIITVVPARVFLPPHVNMQLPAGTILTLSNQQGNIVPLSPYYQGSYLSSVTIPTAAVQSSLTFQFNYTLMITTQQGDTNEDRVIAIVNNITHQQVEQAMKDNADLQNAINRYLANNTQVDDELTNKFNDLAKNLSGRDQGVIDAVNRANDQANRAVELSKDKPPIWPIVLVGCVSGIALCLSVFSVVKVSAATIITTTPFQAKILGGNVSPQAAEDTTLEVVMPYVLITMMSLMALLMLVRMIKNVCCANSGHKALKFFVGLMNLITLVATMVYVGNMIYPLEGVHSLFTDSFVLAFFFLSVGTTQLTASYVLAIMGGRIIGAQSAIILPGMTAQPPIGLTAMPTTLPTDCSSSWDWAGWLLLALFIISFILNIGALVQHLYIKAKNIPKEWICLSSSKRFTFFHRKLHPIAIKTHCTKNVIAAAGQECDNGELIELFYHVGWAETFQDVTSVILPNKVGSKSGKSVVCGNKKKVKSVPMPCFPDPRYIQKSIDDKIYMFNGTETTCVVREIIFSDVYKDKKMRHVIKNKEKENFETKIIMDHVQSVVTPSDTQQTAKQLAEEALGKVKKEKIWKGNRPSPAMFLSPAGELAITLAAYSKLHDFALENGKHFPPYTTVSDKSNQFLVWDALMKLGYSKPKATSDSTA